MPRHWCELESGQLQKQVRRIRSDLERYKRHGYILGKYRIFLPRRKANVMAMPIVFLLRRDLEEFNSYQYLGL